MARVCWPGSAVSIRCEIPSYPDGYSWPLLLLLAEQQPRSRGSCLIACSFPNAPFLRSLAGRRLGHRTRAEAFMACRHPEHGHRHILQTWQPRQSVHLLDCALPGLLSRLSHHLNGCARPCMGSDPHVGLA